jgi:hypothetical protein
MHGIWHGKAGVSRYAMNAQVLWMRLGCTVVFVGLVLVFAVFLVSLPLPCGPITKKKKGWIESFNLIALTLCCSVRPFVVPCVVFPQVMV